MSTAGAGDTSILLVAHGSEHSGRAASAAMMLADAFRAAGFEEVRLGFWKEEPFLHQALRSCRRGRVLVVPVFFAEGYFVRVVVPRELGLDTSGSLSGDRRVRMTRPIGVHEGIETAVVARAKECLVGTAELTESTLVVMGHGTRRHAASGDTVFTVCRRLSDRGAARRVLPAFIDQDPELASVLAGLPSGPVVVVPFLASPGWHGGVTVPSLLAETEGGGTRGGDGDHHSDGVDVRYAQPVGTHPAVAELVVESARRTLADQDARPPDAAEPTSLPRTGRSGDPSSIRVGSVQEPVEAALEERLRRCGASVLLEVLISSTADGYDLRHVEDRDEDRGALTPLEPRALESLARRTVEGEHRPLRSAADLARGWRVEGLDAGELVEALVAVYGSALFDWFEASVGTLEAPSFREVASRQTGTYASTRTVRPDELEAGVEGCCARRGCLRVRSWGPGGSPEHRTAGAPPRRLEVPCERPCPLFFSELTELGS